MRTKPGEIIEDTISRNKKFQEKRRERVEHLKKLKAPQIIIDTEEMIANMTIAEYDVYTKEMQREQDRADAEYAKNNPLQKHIVDEIYARVEKLEFDYFVYSSTVRFNMAIDPLGFMSEEDFHHDLYQTFLDHAKEIYREKYKTAYYDYIKDDEEDET